MRPILVTIAIVSIATMGCVDLEESDADRGDPICLDCHDWAVDEGESEPMNGDDAKDDGDSPGEILNSLSPCMPRAMGHPTDLMPEIPDQVSTDSCPLRETTEHRGNAEESVVWSWNDRVLERVNRRDGEQTRRVEFHFDAALEQVRDIKEHRTWQSSYTANPGQSHDETWWRFDEQQQLVEYTQERWEQLGNQRHERGSRSIHQDWDQDRLVRRSDERINGSESTVVEMDWIYDERGRLAEVQEVVDGELTHRSVWDYEADKPTGVERMVKGIVVEAQRFQYEDDRLASRQIELMPVAFDDRPDNWPGIGNLDNHDRYTARPSQRYYGVYGPFENPWQDANSHRHSAADDECYELPTSIGHGYPSDEADYRLAFSDGDDAPAGIGFAYLNSGYGYGYGDSSWYGHFGVASAWPRPNLGDHPMSSEMSYDDQGRMVDETLVFRDREGDGVTVERSREFESAGLSQDALVVERNGERARAKLEFERDDQGRLVQRTNRHRGEIAAYQKWEYGAADHATALEISAASNDEDGQYYYYDLRSSPTWILTDRTLSPRETARYVRQFDDQGRRTYFGHESVLDESTHRIQTEYEAVGPVAETEEYESGDSLSRNHTFWEYDEAGHLVRKAKEADDGTTSLEFEYIRDEEGRLIEEVKDYGYTVHHHQYTYACSE